MARRTIVTYYDDLDGKPIDDGLAQTFEFTVDGVTYELDLRPANADAFRKDLTHWITIAQRQKRDATRRPPVTGTRKRHKTVAGTKEQLAAIRAWAKTHGYQVSDRGRIPQRVIDQFEAAHR
ncbi:MULTISPECIES: histone-like nucleoid-structuring protein Lsr2 [Rhodococcus]|uniref:Lysyl tRNA synthetase like protein Lsr2 n=2 Tax=Rhodococcus TaxID=1827 RepID=A0A0M9WQ50_RHORH|nr:MULTISPECIES: Lsr2 family protein [Rhodococcus]EME65520.1 putative lysyl tRNA synthetase like protein Lsr2 [Rhodococcus ruber BKS 20-38]KOS57400.1 lysyl tRNA synthetase like protein Lsr2 [Rhodococcus rhodochrous KG-21]